MSAETGVVKMLVVKGYVGVGVIDDVETTGCVDYFASWLRCSLAFGCATTGLRRGAATTRTSTSNLFASTWGTER
jgi:hypothetical protein